MKYDIDNQSKLSKAFQTRDAGLQVVKPGKTAVLDLRDDPTPTEIAVHGKSGVMIAPQRVEPKAKVDTRKLEMKAAD